MILVDFVMVFKIKVKRFTDINQKQGIIVENQYWNELSKGRYLYNLLDIFQNRENNEAIISSRKMVSVGFDSRKFYCNQIPLNIDLKKGGKELLFFCISKEYYQVLYTQTKTKGLYLDYTPSPQPEPDLKFPLRTSHKCLRPTFHIIRKFTN